MTKIKKVNVCIQNKVYPIFQVPKDFQILNTNTNTQKLLDLAVYYISEWGQIYNSATNYLINGVPDIQSYICVQLTNGTDGEVNKLTIHRLAASVFIKRQTINQFTNGLSIYNKDLESHHRDGNRSNNFFENIQFVTQAQNLICAHGKALVALTENKNAIPITYWSMKSCYST
jgi:hypothetical protein